MVDAVSFTTFLKISMQATTNAKIKEIEKLYTGEGGYDFYKKLKRVPVDFANGKLKVNQLTGYMSGITRDVEKTHNTKMALAFCNWWQAQNNVSAVKRPKPLKYIPTGFDFKIRIAPELAYTDRNEHNLIYLWAVAKPALNKITAGAGIKLLKDAFSETPYSDYSMKILDLRKNKLFDENSLTNQSGLILNAELAQFDAIKKSLGV